MSANPWHKEDALQCEAQCRCGTFQFEVPYRGKDEEILHWVEFTVAPTMRNAHNFFSPNCNAKNFDLHLPIAGQANGIGKRVLNG